MSPSFCFVNSRYRCETCIRYGCALEELLGERGEPELGAICDLYLVDFGVALGGSVNQQSRSVLLRVVRSSHFRAVWGEVKGIEYES